MSAALLAVEGLQVGFDTERGPLRAVDGLSLQVDEGEVVAIVGESGSGKSAAALAIMGLSGREGASVAGSVRLEGEELIGAPQRRLREIRGARIAMVFQDPMSSLNPVRRIGDQIAEQIRAHERLPRAQARERAVASLRRAGIADAERRAHAYPHELSGGLRQRAMIAMALSCSPQLIIADEPTTALDVTIQAQVLSELARLRAEDGTAVLLITHDLGVVAGIADRVVVMYAGQAVEQGSAEQVFADPQHPCTWGLLGSIPRIESERAQRLASIPGAPPSPLALPPGCRFAERCPHAFERCAEPVELLARAAPDGGRDAGGSREGHDDLERAERARVAPGHLDRCVLAPELKRARRLVGGRIGL